MRTTISAQVLASVATIADRTIIHQFFDGIKTIVESFEIDAQDKRIALTAPLQEKDLRLNIHGRQAYAVNPMNGGFQWWFMLRTKDVEQMKLSALVEPHRHFSGDDGKGLYGTITPDLSEGNYKQLFHLCLDACKEYLPTQSASPFRKSHRPEMYEMALDPSLRDEAIAQSMEEEVYGSHPFEHLIEVYKDQVREDNNEPERYKWICTQTFQDNWDIDAPDFGAMLKAAMRDQENLLYHNSAGFILKVAEQFPEDVRWMFRDLYTESVALPKRLVAFTKAAEAVQQKMQKALGKTLKHMQDERTISFYLAMRFPENYPLYKPDIYDLLLQTVISRQNPARAAERRKAGEKLLHFLELGKELLPLITADEELQELVADTLTDDCWKGPQQWLIFQDILWRNRQPVAPQLPAEKTYADAEPQMELAEDGETYSQIAVRPTGLLNTIFYGPPGTGKTFHLQKQFDLFTDKPRKPACESVEISGR